MVITKPKPLELDKFFKLLTFSAVGELDVAVRSMLHQVATDLGFMSPEEHDWAWLRHCIGEHIVQHEIKVYVYYIHTSLITLKLSPQATVHAV